jgi:hypothetical protein
MVGGRLEPACRWRSTAIGGVFSAPLSRSWGPASRPISIFQTVSKEEFSEVRGSKLPHSGGALAHRGCWGGFLVPIGTALAAFVARIRIKRLRLAISGLPEKFPLPPVLITPRAFEWTPPRQRPVRPCGLSHSSFSRALRFAPPLSRKVFLMYTTAMCT